MVPPPSTVNQYTTLTWAASPLSFPLSGGAYVPKPGVGIGDAVYFTVGNTNNAFNSTLLKLQGGVFTTITLPGASAVCHTSSILVGNSGRILVTGYAWNNGSPVLDARCMWTSTNSGATWSVTNFPSGLFGTSASTTYTYANGKFWAFGRLGTTNAYTSQYRTSTDGITWTAAVATSLNDATDPFPFFQMATNTAQSIIVGQSGSANRYYTATTGSSPIVTGVPTPGVVSPDRRLGWLPERNSFIGAKLGSSARVLELSRATSGQSWETFSPAGTSLYECFVGTFFERSSVVIFTRFGSADDGRIVLSFDGGSTFSVVAAPTNSRNASFGIIGDKVYGNVFFTQSLYVGTLT
jgi:hypothetical protein